MSKDKKKRRTKVNPFAGGVGHSHFLRTGGGFHSPRKYTKNDRKWKVDE